MKAHRHFASHLPLAPLARLSRRLWAGMSSDKSPAPAAARSPIAAFEPLESRTLMSASVIHAASSSHAKEMTTAPSPLTTLRADAKALEAEFVALKKVDAANLKAITADLKAADLLKTDKAELKALSQGDDAELKVLGNEVKHALNTIRNEASSLNSDGKKLLKAAAKGTPAKKTSRLAAKVKAEISKLSGSAASGLTGLGKDAPAVTTTFVTNSSALAKLNPTDAKLNMDVMTAQSHLSSAEQTLDAIVTKLLTTDVNSLIGLYSDIPIAG